MNFKQLATQELTFEASAPGRQSHNDESGICKGGQENEVADGVKKHSIPCQVIAVSLGGNPLPNSNSNPLKPDAQPSTTCAEIRKAQLRVRESIRAQNQTVNVISVH